MQPNATPAQVSPKNFFRAWKIVCEARLPELLREWERPPSYTALVLDSADDVITQVGRLLQLKAHGNYYALDAILFKESDLVRCRPMEQTWVHSIRVAFEHENFFTSGLFQETSHLLITRAELRVLVTYPEYYEVQPELDRLSQIIAVSGLEEPAFLFITGLRTCDKLNVLWTGYTFQEGRLTPLPT